MRDFPGGPVVKTSPSNAWGWGSSFEDLLQLCSMWAGARLTDFSVKEQIVDILDVRGHRVSLKTI